MAAIAKASEILPTVGAPEKWCKSCAKAKTAKERAAKAAEVKAEKAEAKKAAA